MHQLLLTHCILVLLRDGTLCNASQHVLEEEEKSAIGQIHPRDYLRSMETKSMGSDNGMSALEIRGRRPAV